MDKALLLTGLLGATSFLCLAQNAPAPEHESPRRTGTVVRIDLIGDSTQTDNAGYGRRGKVNDQAGDDANETVQSEILQKFSLIVKQRKRRQSSGEEKQRFGPWGSRSIARVISTNGKNLSRIFGKIPHVRSE